MLGRFVGFIKVKTCFNMMCEKSQTGLVSLCGITRSLLHGNACVITIKHDLFSVKLGRHINKNGPSPRASAAYICKLMTTLSKEPSTALTLSAFISIKLGSWKYPEIRILAT